MTATTAAPPKLDTYKAKVAELETEEQELLTFLATSPDREAELRMQLLRENPNRPVDARTPVENERRKRRDSEKRLDAVRLNLSTFRQLHAEAERAELEQRAKHRVEEVAEWQQRERDAYKAFADKFVELVHAYADVKEVVESFDAWRESQSFELGASAEMWRQGAAHHVVEPIPADFGAALQMCLDAAIDPNGHGYRRDNPDCRPVDDWDELRKLVPDLRGVVQNVFTARGPSRYSQSAQAVAAGWNASTLDSGFGKSWSES